MIISLLFSNYILFIIIVASLIIGLTVHEFMHAWTANKLGDPTAKMMGRMTLNPLAHLDLYGSIFILIAGFGWGKPVIVNPRNFANPKLDNLTVSLAGPMSNLVIAIIFGLIIRFFSLPEIANTFLAILVYFNLLFMIFNFLPIPPLDGSKLLALFLPEESFVYLQQIGILLLFGLILFSNVIPLIPLINTKVVFTFFSWITGKPALLGLIFG